ncbi:hypothetical protein SCORR_v1c04260 [Spiroplasma corruscae]|uniref:Schlafen group 3-like DNA/RNA helicase domain-containing protein n=1 Tax=Spiroplasma corruscae TaxID=216934 RepID=A0A222ENW6_9MOLU|nr:DNA/RNA helicase domain-containing protein [Spiroplasma corruscae]ASP28200.1 hypothetical protein SCORR_v1c04260 [Spiroplasma corruscae]
MVKYKANVSKLINDIGWKNFSTIFGELFYEAQKGEMKSWDVSLKEFWKVLLLTNLNDNVDIYLEYTFDFASSRCDVIITGKINGVDKIMIIELKQHSRVIDITNKNDLLIYKSSKSSGTLSNQIKRYINFFQAFIEINNIKNTNIIGVGFLHDMWDIKLEEKKVIEDNNDWIVDNLKFKLFIKNQYIEFANYITEEFKNAENSNFIDDFEKSLSIRGIKTIDVIKNKISDKELILTDQQKLFSDDIKYNINSKNAEKKLFIIEGNAGTGKTILIYSLYLYLRNSSKFNNSTHIMARNSTFIRNINSFLNDGYKFKQSSSVVKRKTDNNQVILFDEGQRLTMEQIIKAIDNSKAIIICIDEKQKINYTDEVRKKLIIDYFKAKYPKGIHKSYLLENSIRFLNNRNYIKLVYSFFNNDFIHCEENANIYLYNNQSQLHQKIIELNNNSENLMIKSFKLDDDAKKYSYNWINSSYKMNEIASIYYVHGLEVDYVVIYIPKYIEVKDKNYVEFVDSIKTNRFLTLLTRALKGAFIYCEDEKLYNILYKKLNY